MNVAEAALLGLVQGLTEFLPVSSSGHLVLAQEVLGVQQTGKLLEVLVHLATAASVVVYYRRDIVETTRHMVTGGPGRGLVLRVVVGTVPAVVAVLLFKAQLEAALESPLVASLCLCVTGALLWSTRFARRRHDLEPGIGYALAVGVSQAMAILPGISRSGSTIATGLFLGDEPGRAARFSFLLSLPAILGAGALTAGDLWTGEEAATGETGPLAVAAVVAFLSGLAAIHALVLLVSRGRLGVFAPYCLLVGGGFLTYLALG